MIENNRESFKWSLRLVKYLIANGSDINEKDDFGSNCLLYASANGL